jgi:hypothetical protein
MDLSFFSFLTTNILLLLITKSLHKTNRYPCKRNKSRSPINQIEYDLMKVRLLIDLSTKPHLNVLLKVTFKMMLSIFLFYSKIQCTLNFQFCITIFFFAQLCITIIPRLRLGMTKIYINYYIIISFFIMEKNIVAQCPRLHLGMIKIYNRIFFYKVKFVKKNVSNLLKRINDDQ